MDVSGGCDECIIEKFFENLELVFAVAIESVPAHI